MGISQQPAVVDLLTFISLFIYQSVVLIKTHLTLVTFRSFHPVHDQVAVSQALSVDVRMLKVRSQGLPQGAPLRPCLFHGPV